MADENRYDLPLIHVGAAQHEESTLSASNPREELSEQVRKNHTQPGLATTS